MKYVISIVVSLLVGLGLGFAIPHGANNLVGSGVSLDRHFTYGFYAGSTDQFTVDSSGNASSSALTASGNVYAAAYKTTSVGAASTTADNATVALGSASAGFITIGTSTPAGLKGRTVNASTTAVTINSQIFLTQSATTTIPGTTCNSTPATSTIIAAIVPGSGFTAQAGSIPTTNPNCYYFRILN